MIGGPVGPPPLFFFWRSKIEERNKRGKRDGLTASPFPSCPNFIAPSPAQPSSNNPHPCAIRSPIIATSRHKAHCVTCRDVAIIGNNVTLPAIFFRKKTLLLLSPFFIATGRQSHCRPARRHGKPWSPPATIPATETIEGL